MDYLEFWRKGFKEGKEFSLEQINEHCKTTFQSLTELILYIREVEFNKKREAENDKS
jgi:hypothetical protein